MASIFFKQDTVEDSSLCGEPEPRHTGFLNGLYYIFYESRVHSVVAESVPLVIWLSGGPGCSSLVGMLFENGPCIVGEDSPATISLNVNSWTQAAHMVYIDQPRGTGFSPARSSLRSWSEATAVDDLVSFLDEFYIAFPTFASNELYIFGESYAGHYIPDLAHGLLLRNSRAFQNLKGIGTIELATTSMTKPRIIIALFDTLGPFVKSVNNDILLTEANDYVESCEEAIQACQDPAIGGQGDCSKVGYTRKTLKVTVCQALSSNVMAQVYRQGLNHYNLDRKCHSDMFRLCYRFQPLYTFVNSQVTMAKLGLSGHSWAPCNSDVFAGHLDKDYFEESEGKVATLLDHGIRVLIYAGDKDLVCNWMAQDKWTREMTWHGHDEFNGNAMSAYVFKGEKHGQVRSAQGLTFFRVYNAGHMVPLDQPAVALDVFRKFITNHPLV
ncbi:hypothetical protein AaE_007284 [Aphanomyces astaci]|uniref:Carboxypeptidase n=1 Tax=Aphanomyces astaci TaxID=112090 RepID=A0A6A4ZXY9_APHAT|nr:hypothetical protein AaE_007284 [Aphanomyces astaci]